MKMKKAYIGIAIALVAVVGATVASMLAVSAQEPVQISEPPVLMIDPPATHYCDSRSDGITVQGVGVVTLPATIGVVELGVDVTAETVSEARGEAATSMQSIIDAIKEVGVEDDQIQTTRLSIWPETTWVEETVELGEGRIGEGGRSVIIGYRVSNRVRVEVDTVAIEEATADDDAEDEAESDGSDILSNVIDAAAAAGGDAVRIDSISFRADDTPESVDQARMMAVSDAVRRSKLYAQAFGVEVGALLMASEAISTTPVFDGIAFAETAVSSYGRSTPISAGDVEIQANITAKFAIVQPGCFIR